MMTSMGYLYVLKKDHPRSCPRGYVAIHILVAEEKLGRPLNKTEIPHHIDGNKRNNHPDNIYVCANRAEHNEIHRAYKAYKACGHASWIRCPVCKQYDAPEKLTVMTIAGRQRGRHKDCHTQAERKRRGV